MDEMVTMDEMENVDEMKTKEHMETKDHMGTKEQEKGHGKRLADMSLGGALDHVDAAHRDVGRCIEKAYTHLKHKKSASRSPKSAS